MKNIAKTLKFLNKKDAFCSVLDDTQDVANDDIEKMKKNNNTDFLSTSVLELSAYIKALIKIKHDNHKKYVMGDGFAVHYMYPYPISNDTYKKINHLYAIIIKRLIQDSPFSVNNVTELYKTYQFEDKHVASLLQPLVNTLAHKYTKPVKTDSPLINVVNFNETINPHNRKNDREIGNLLVNRALFLMDCYKTQLSLKNK